MKFRSDIKILLYIIIGLFISSCADQSAVTGVELNRNSTSNRDTLIISSKDTLVIKDTIFVKDTSEEKYNDTTKIIHIYDTAITTYTIDTSNTVYVIDTTEGNSSEKLIALSFFSGTNAIHYDIGLTDNKHYLYNFNKSHYRDIFSIKLTAMYHSSGTITLYNIEEQKKICTIDHIDKRDNPDMFNTTYFESENFIDSVPNGTMSIGMITSGVNLSAVRLLLERP